VMNVAKTEVKLVTFIRVDCQKKPWRAPPRFGLRYVPSV
jgi:hypothetical protein